MGREFYAHHDHVFIEPIVETMTEGGIALIEHTDEDAPDVRMKHGTVRFAGKGKLLEDGQLSPLQAYAGLEVLYYVLPRTGRRVKVNGVEMDVVRDIDIAGHYV